MSDKPTYVSGKFEETFAEFTIKNIFVLFFAAGLISIAIGIFWSQRILLAVFVPVCLVFGYAYFTTSVLHTDLSKSKIGDSCYFLGFSFTLISLSIALIKLGQEDIGNMDIRSVMGSFGAALATTLAGLLSRLWHTVLTSSFQSSKEKLEEEIENAMRSFSQNLHTIVEDVNASITTIGLTITDTNRALDTSYRGQMQENIKTISGSIANFAQRLDEVEVSKDMVVKPINIALTGMISTLNEHNKKMAKVHGNVVKGIDGLSKQIDLSNDLVNQYIDRFSLEFQRVSDNHISV